MKAPIAIVSSEFDDMMTIDVMLSNVCNYKCHYCHPGSNEGDKPFPKNYELFKKNLSHMIDVYRNDFNKRDIRIEITGGEPTLWPLLGEFAQWLKEDKKINNILLVTNASRTLRWFEEYGNYFDAYHISLHSEEQNPQHTVEVAEYLFQNTSAFVAMNVIMDPVNYTKSQEHLRLCLDNDYKWLVKTWMLIENNQVRTDYTAEQLLDLKDKVKRKPDEEYIQSFIDKGIIPGRSKAKVVYDDGTIEPYNSYELRTTNRHDYRGWLCNLGIDRVSLFVGQLTGSCGSNYLYNRPTMSLFDENFVNEFTKDIVKPIICRQPSCAACTKDIKIPKAKIHVQS